MQVGIVAVRANLYGMNNLMKVLIVVSIVLVSLFAIRAGIGIVRTLEPAASHSNPPGCIHEQDERVERVGDCREGNGW